MVPAQPAAVRTVRRFDTIEPVVTLTIDAGADRGFTMEILDTLAAHSVRASFGITGAWASQNPELIRRMARDGHHLINHSWSHQDFTGLSPAERAEELKRTETLIRAQVDLPLAPYFRPPYGEYDAAVLAGLAASGYTLNVLWTVDSLGWQGRSAAQITQRVLAGAVPGAIMLFHVGAASEDAAALPEIIAQLGARGYRFATVADFVTGALPPPRRRFPETGYTLSGDFLAYWERNGGLPVFGYPLSEEVEERNPDTGQTGRVQYVERQRFEYHPWNAGTPYTVLLGRLGVEVLQRQGLDWRTFPRADPAAPHYFGETGHATAPQFWDYWRGHGLEFGDAGISAREALALFGYPITEPRMETNPSGDRVLTQWFERARFEHHPNNPAPYRVLLGRLGAVLHAQP